MPYIQCSGSFLKALFANHGSLAVIMLNLKHIAICDCAATTAIIEIKLLGRDDRTDNSYCIPLMLQS